jgi:hypothetical protein
MMSADSGGTWNVSGSSMAIATTGLMPGRIPTSVPSSAPTRQ